MACETVDLTALRTSPSPLQTTAPSSHHLLDLFFSAQVGCSPTHFVARHMCVPHPHQPYPSVDMPLTPRFLLNVRNLNRRDSRRIRWQFIGS